jgi:hypothetical protein
LCLCVEDPDGKGWLQGLALKFDTEDVRLAVGDLQPGQSARSRSSACPRTDSDPGSDFVVAVPNGTETAKAEGLVVQPSRVTLETRDVSPAHPKAFAGPTVLTTGDNMKGVC